jgi:hypothetical protein
MSLLRALLRLHPRPGGFGRSKLGKDKKGAVLVEFALAILPVFMIFFGTVQYCVCAYVNLVLRHGAFVAARCMAVVHPGMPDAGKPADCTDGVNALFGNDPNLKATVTLENAPNKMAETLDTTEVELKYECKVPLGNVIACGAARKKTFKATASFPNQGASYQKIWGY